MKRVWSRAALIIKGVVSNSFTASPLRKIFGQHHCFELYCFAFIHSLDTPLNRLLVMLHSFGLRNVLLYHSELQTCHLAFPIAPCHHAAIYSHKLSLPLFDCNSDQFPDTFFCPNICTPYMSYWKCYKHYAENVYSYYVLPL